MYKNVQHVSYLIVILNVFSLRLKTRQRRLLLLLLFNIIFKLLTTKIREEKETVAGKE